MSTMFASKFSRLKLALDIAVSAPKNAIQITVLDHLTSASTTASMNTMRAEDRSILKPAWLSEWLVCNHAAAVSTKHVSIGAKQSTIAASLSLDNKFAGSIEINALQCVILNADLPFKD